MINDLYEKILNVVNVDRVIVKMTYERNDTIRMFINELVASLENPIKSSKSASLYLMKYDPTFEDAIRLTLSNGNKVTDLNSKLIASVHNEYRLRKTLNKKLNHLAKQYKESKRK